VAYIQSGINIDGIVWMYRYYIVDKLKIVQVSFTAFMVLETSVCVKIKEIPSSLVV